MTLRPGALRGAGGGSGPARAVIDHRLARRFLIAEYRRGRLAQHQVCDAHPELIRAAKNIGLSREEVCPICSHEAIRWVRYVYGEELKRNSGRVVYPEEWLSELAGNHDEFTCYVVEVCIDCSWNHLVRSYMAGRRFRNKPAGTERRERG